MFTVSGVAGGPVAAPRDARIDEEDARSVVAANGQQVRAQTLNGQILRDDNFAGGQSDGVRTRPGS